jgi:hypothetical protein
MRTKVDKPSRWRITGPAVTFAADRFDACAIPDYVAIARSDVTASGRTGINSRFVAAGEQRSSGSFLDYSV